MRWTTTRPALETCVHVRLGTIIQSSAPFLSGCTMQGALGSSSTGANFCISSTKQQATDNLRPNCVRGWWPLQSTGAQSKRRSRDSYSNRAYSRTQTVRNTGTHKCEVGGCVFNDPKVERGHYSMQRRTPPAVALEMQISSPCPIVSGS